jgi:hypothetical protein
MNAFINEGLIQVLFAEGSFNTRLGSGQLSSLRVQYPGNSSIGYVPGQEDPGRQMLYRAMFPLL